MIFVDSREAQHAHEKRTLTSLPSSLRKYWKRVMKPRHFRGLMLRVRPKRSCGAAKVAYEDHDGGGVEEGSRGGYYGPWVVPEPAVPSSDDPFISLPSLDR